MAVQIKDIEFSKLRSAYNTVKNFVERESYEKVSNLNTKICDDLGLVGDDNLELVDKFVTTFKLEYEEFDYSKHFYSEGELFDSTSAFLFLTITLPVIIFDYLTLKQFKIKYPDFTPNREVSDLSFRELLTWYIEGKYSDTKIKYQLAYHKL